MSKRQAVQSISILAIALLASAGPNTFARTCDGLFRPAAPTRLGDLQVNTAKACLAAGECVVLLNKPSNRPALTSTQLSFILGHGGWIVADRSSDLPSVNCHGYSCQTTGVPNFPDRAWLDPKDFVPLLKEYFLDYHAKFSEADFRRFTLDPNAREGDLVLMTNFNRVLNHSGVVKRVQVGGQFQNWISSKLDEGPVVLTPIGRLAEYYQVQHLLITRRKPSSLISHGR